MIFRFLIPHRTGHYTATATNWREARKIVNPYMTSYREAKARASHYSHAGILSEAEWWNRMAEVHANAARDFHAAATVETVRVVVERGASGTASRPATKPTLIPLARHAPPLVPPLAKLAPPKAKLPDWMESHRQVPRKQQLVKQV